MTKPKCKLCGLEDGACICAHLRSSPATSDLLPCPFCGADGIVEQISMGLGRGPMNRASCHNCGCCLMLRADACDAIEVWNTRASLQTATPTGGDETNSNAAPANRATAERQPPIVGDDRESMGSGPVKGIVTGGSDPSPSSADREGVRWARVNDEPFEYAIQQGPHGDEFVKLLNGTCLRRAAPQPSSAGSRDALELVRKIKSLGFVGSDDLTDQEMQLVVTALKRFGATAQRPSDAFIQGIREALIEKCVRVVEGTGAAMFSDGEAEAVDALRSDIAAGIRALALPSANSNTKAG